MGIFHEKEITKLFLLYKKQNKKIYLVGGCLRDLLLGKDISDYDFATDALPEESKRILHEAHIIDIGKKFGTLKVFLHDFEFEITPFRKESDYDHRKPGTVSFGADLKEDLKRRDFTINALAWSPEENIIDYFNGKKDLEEKTIRAIGNPKERFEEDALRILRAIRFGTMKGFDIEKSTIDAVKKQYTDLQYISKERILDELTKIMTGEDPVKGMELLEETGIMEFIFPYHNKGNYSLLKSKDIIIQTAILLHEIYGDRTLQKKHLSDYPYSKETRRKVLFLLENKDLPLLTDPYEIRKNIAKSGTENIFKLLDFKEMLDLDIQNYRNALDKDLKENPCLSIKDLAVDGKDLIRENIPKGPLLGKYLELLLEEVLKNPSYNTKEKLLEILGTLKKIHE